MPFDPIYLLFLAPAFLASWWASQRVRSTFSHFSQIGTMRQVTGAEAARYILEKSGIYDVQIVPIAGQMTDHYNPQTRQLALSEPVYDSTSVAAVGVAAHEAGHAIQHATGYWPLWFRSVLVAITGTGANFGMTAMMIGLLLNPMSGFGRFMIIAGAILFSALLVFQLVTLPVEFDASARAKARLSELNIIYPEERHGVNSVLSAAAWTYVAAPLQTIMTVLYFLFRAGLLGGHRRNSNDYE